MFRPIVRGLPLKRAYHKLLGGNLVGRAKYLIATSDQEKSEMIEDGVPAWQVVVRRNGIEFPERLPERGDFRRKWNIPADVKLVLFLGRLVSKKSPDMLMAAFAGWREKSSNRGGAILVLAGPAEGDGFADRLKKSASELGLERSVVFTGPLYDDAKWEAYRDADVFVLASQNENFGNTAGEAAACGTPVIVTDRCGIAPYVGQAGIVIRHDRVELERALEELLGEQQLHQYRSAACAEMARALSWERPLAQNEDLYKQCLMEFQAA